MFVACVNKTATRFPYLDGLRVATFVMSSLKTVIIDAGRAKGRSRSLRG